MNYDINKFISEAKTKTYIELIEYCEDKLNWLDKIRFSKKSPLKDKEYEIKKYHDFIHEYLFFLRSGIKPAGMRKEDFEMTKEITTELVNKKNLKEEILKVYEK
ncbi:MAG TPA: hypothetical protein VN958_14855 [Chitinophagaceae bacterium]|nr:hypothetical protein [Chitinophagaceae bacterium]